jgi:hypothetical protein
MNLRIVILPILLLTTYSFDLIGKIFDIIKHDKHGLKISRTMEFRSDHIVINKTPLQSKMWLSSADELNE